MSNNKSQRCGVLARKIGMTRHFTNMGMSYPVTILHLDLVQVVGHRVEETHGYDAVIVGAGHRKHGNKPLKGVYASRPNLGLKHRYCEFRVTKEHLLPVEQALTPEHFSIGQSIDVTGISKGKGFAGAMKRHNFRGLRASHGVSVSHRSHGSTGNRQDPGRVFKNKKMAGHMGDRRVTIQNLRVLAHDVANNLLMVSGPVPGSGSGWLCVRDAVKSSGTEQRV